MDFLAGTSARAEHELTPASNRRAVFAPRTGRCRTVKPCNSLIVKKIDTLLACGGRGTQHYRPSFLRLQALAMQALAMQALAMQALD
ncbi:MAG TPA: hypothetical protein VHS58_19745 [Acetobacteraceae bacterium]|nr:hypothetical protein [Acetobacteraceae bacterium]